MTTGAESLWALLAGSVDYAGLFPPAGLELRPALENHLDYMRGNDAWMLGCFVLPTVKWPQTLQILSGCSRDASRPLRISALGAKSDSAVGFLENLHTVLRPIAHYGRRFHEVLSVEQLEMPLPAESAPVLGTILWKAAGLMETQLSGPVCAFWEVPFSECLPETLRVIAAHNARTPLADRWPDLPRFQADGTPLPDSPTVRTFQSAPFGIKLRTGGTEVAAFPTTEQLADALLAARDAGVALKFTAGLHHPVRHFDAGLGTHMHGFLNVFAAGILAREHRLDATETRAILEDERAESFRFDAGGFAWRERRIPTDALAEHRRFITSFGSCSFDEPRDDLRWLGLLA